ncbi:MAG TPA: hypothetical protein VGM43_22555, partial [Bryobacteraceae bacterium]
MSTATAPLTSQYIVLKAGKFDTQNAPGEAGLVQVFSEIKETKPERLVIHFHGGLVDRALGETAAAELLPLYTSAGATPLFVIWETGWKEIVEQNIPTIFKEDIFNRLVRRVAQFVKAKADKETSDDGTRGIGAMELPKEGAIKAEIDKAQNGEEMFQDAAFDQLPRSTQLTADEQEQIQKEIENDKELRTELQQIANARKEPSEEVTRSVTEAGSSETLMSPEVLEDISPTATGERGLISTVMLAKHVVVIVASVISRLSKGRGHGVYLTIVEEVMREFYIRNVGKFLWDSMKKEVDQAFGFAADSGGAAFVRHFKDMWDAGVRPTVTLIGHSAGSIYVARLLKELDHALEAYPEAKVNVVLIAPAVTFTEYADALRSAGKRIAGLRIFGMSDSIEREDRIAKALYPASLLYFVSGVLEESRDEPLVGMQRYYDKPYTGPGFEAVEYARNFSCMKRQFSAVWSDITQGPGCNSDMRSHGGWVQSAATKASVMEIITNG